MTFLLYEAINIKSISELSVAKDVFLFKRIMRLVVILHNKNMLYVLYICPFKLKENKRRIKPRKYCFVLQQKVNSINKNKHKIPIKFVMAARVMI